MEKNKKGNEPWRHIDYTNLMNEKFWDWLFQFPKYNREFFEKATRKERREYNLQYIYLAGIFVFCAAISLPINWLFRLGYGDTKMLLFVAACLTLYWDRPLLVPNLWRTLRLKVRCWINKRAR